MLKVLSKNVFFGGGNFVKAAKFIRTIFLREDKKTDPDLIIVLVKKF